MTDNGVYLVDKQTGAHRTIVEGKLAVPADLAVTSEAARTWCMWPTCSAIARSTAPTAT